MKHKKMLWASLGLLAAFAIWTALVRTVDVAPVGQNASRVGFAAVNRAFHRLTGTHMGLYVLTDWLGLVPIVTACVFAVMGLWQWIKRKRLLQVERDLLAMGVLYLAVIAVYALFEVAVVNRRPVLIEGVLEASYPSSTTFLVLTVMPAAALWLERHIRARALRRCAVCLVAAFATFMVVARLFSGVHWLSDIIGGVLISASLVTGYAALR